MTTSPSLNTTLVACAAASLLWFGSGTALACKCAPPPETEVARGDASAVFEGRVTTIADGPDGAGEKRVTLAVVRTWKGLVNDETITLSTRAESAACGFPFEAGASYLVYASGDGGTLSVSHCGRTKVIADAGDDLHTLGAGITPVHVAADGGALTDGGAPSDASVPAKAAAPSSGGCAGGHAGAKGTMLWLGIPGLAMWTRRRKGR